MFALAVSWLVFPALLGTLCLGAGAALSRPSDTDRAEWLATCGPLGFAGLIVLSQVTVVGRYGAWIFVAAATVLTGFGVRRLLAIAPLPRPVAAAVVASVVFVIFAVPVVGYGSATFAGYTTLGDTAIQLLGADALASGQALDEPPSSSAGAALQAYLVDTGYPSGALTLLGAGARMVLTDVAWVYQPFLAIAAVMLALTIYGLTASLRLSPRWRVAVAVVAAQPSLLFAYFLQGSIKEVVAAALIAVLAFQVARVVAASPEWRVPDIIPIAIPVAALIGTVGLAAAVWVVPAVLALLVLSWRALRERPAVAAGMVLVGVGVVALGSIRALAGARGYLDVAEVTTSAGELGNLVTPLRKVETLGVWLSGDFRLQPEAGALAVTRVLELIVAIGLAFAVALGVRSRPTGPVVYLLISAAGFIAVSRQGSPWADAKAYAIASPAVLFGCMAGWAMLSARGAWQSKGAVVGGACVAMGVLGSNALAYHNASPAPRARLEELARAGGIAGGPVLFTDFDEFAKYFLRDDDGETIADTWTAGTPRYVSGAGQPEYGRPVRAETLDRGYLDAFAGVILRRGATAVRPASGFRRVWQGRWYEVWKPIRPASGVADVVVAPPDAGGRLDCAGVEALVAQAAEGSVLQWQPAPVSARAPVAVAPRSWRPARSGEGFEPRGGGKASGELVVPRDGRYEVWLRASASATVTVRVGGRRIGSVTHALNEAGGAEMVGTATLPRGRLPWSVDVGASMLMPGAGALNRWIAGIEVRRLSANATPRGLPTADWRRLCALRVAWVELVAPR